MALTLSLILFVAMTAFLIFIILFPERWASIVEKENMYWVEKGMLKAATAEKFVRFERSPVFKIFVFMAMVGFMLMGFLSMK